MHIAFLSPEYPTPSCPEGGLANYVRKVGAALTGRGHKVTVFVASDRNAAWNDNGVLVREVSRFRIPPRLGRPNGVRSLFPALSWIMSSRRLASVLWSRHLQEPIDIVQTSSYTAPGYWLLRNHSIPIVCRISSYTALWRAAYGRSRQFSDHLTDWLEIRQITAADASFAPSRLLAFTLERLEGHAPRVISSPLDEHSYDWNTSFYENHFAGKSYLLYFGQLSAIKGADLLAQVIPDVLERHDDLSFAFLGRDDGMPGYPRLYDYILTHCAEYKDRLHHHESVSKEKLYPVVAGALGVLMPSRIDNYPNACLESQALGIPVIGTYDSSLEEMITDGVTGFLARNNDPVSLRNAIERLLNLSSDQRQHMRQNVLAEIDRIRKEDRISQLIAFYKSVIADFKKRPLRKC